MKHAVLALVALTSGCTQSQSPIVPPAEPQITLSGSRVHFVGPITRASADVIRKILAERRLTVLSMNSAGGDVEAALEIGKLIRDHGMEVEVQTWCMSSCANYVFPSGTRKVISEGAVVAWHGSPSHLHYLDATGRGSSDPVVREHNAALSRREAAFLRGAGVDPFVSWFGKIAPYEVPNFYALTVADMSRFGIKNVAAPESYGPSYLARLPEGLRGGVVFISADAERINAARPQWLR